jgi:putative transposase
VFTGNPGHLNSFDYLGLHRYFLTFCTDNRRHAFVDRAVVDVALQQVLRACADEQFEIIAYCFMPDHLHLLAQGQSDASDCRRFIKRAKQFSGFYYSKQFDAHLWQRYGFERVLRAEDETLVVAKYILANPVRAGLVVNPEDYAFSGSLVYPIHEVLEAIGEYSCRARSA